MIEYAVADIQGEVTGNRRGGCHWESTEEWFMVQLLGVVQMRDKERMIRAMECGYVTIFHWECICDRKT